jgi:aldehyde dehydrogenase (NAD+)
MLEYNRALVGGEWIEVGAEAEVENPATGEIVGIAAAGAPQDMRAAVEAAAAAFPAWSRLDPAARIRHIRDLGAKLGEHEEELARLVTAEVGTPIRPSRAIQVALPGRIVDSYVEAAEALPPYESVGNSRVYRLPVGVVAAVPSWNFPIHQLVCKVVPALLAGCTVVAKPASLAPLSSLRFAMLAQEAGLPAGVLNVVPGDGAAGGALVSDPDVDMVSFTGSTATGRKVAAATAAGPKKTTLELGGKSPNLILADAELQAAVKVGIANAFLNSGQTCNAWTRMLVPDSRWDEALAIAAEAAAKYVPGDPSEESCRLGPVITSADRERVARRIEAGLAEGAELVAGGPAPPEGPLPGHFVSATVLAGVSLRSAAAQEEIFGPVLSIIRYADEEEGIAIANGTEYGLAAAVWAGDQEHGIEVARRLRAGQVDVNGSGFNPAAPFGGFKRSGYGRELGAYGLADFTEPQSLQVG